ncbi:hypothetical protein V6R21_26620 [Limibacter armeniacum]|uniref:hypothetical protein n=1 Tax=Limibacter armeniacum TaxID=466084 RepID=UPI002FE6B20D
MYFSGHLKFDPSQATRIEKKKPLNVFGRMFFNLTAGAFSTQEEHETFCAVSILQQLYQVFISLKVDNIIRLSRNNFDFYLDENSVPDDFRSVVKEFRTGIDSIEAELFDQLSMMLEYEDATFYYLIDININRVHPVGTYPIDIVVNAVLKDFATSTKGDAISLKAKMTNTFASQESYDSYVSNKEQAFNIFLKDLTQKMRQHVGIDDVISETRQKIIRPFKKLEFNNEIPLKHPRSSAPVYSPYYDYTNSFFYAWLWAELLHQNHIEIHNFDLVNSHGSTIIEVGQNGFNAGVNDLMNISVPFPEIDNDSLVTDFPTASIHFIEHHENQQPSTTNFSYANLWGEAINEINRTDA